MPQQEGRDLGQEEAASPVTSTQQLEVLSADLTLRSIVAGNPTTPVGLLEQLARDQDEQVREQVASNPNTSWPILEQLAWEFPYPFLHNPVGPLQILAHPEQISIDETFWAARLREASIPSWWWNWLGNQPGLSTMQEIRLHVQCSGETLSFYGTPQDDNEYTLLTLTELLTAACIQGVSLPALRDPHQAGTTLEQTIRERLQLLAHSLDEKMRFAVAGNEQIPREILQTLALDDAWPVREAVAENLQTPVEVLQSLARDEEAEVQQAVAWNKQTPVEVLQSLSQDQDDYSEVRQIVAENPQTPAEILRILALDRDVEVRWAVARNPQTPLDVLQSLAQNGDKWMLMAVVQHPQTPLGILPLDEEVEVRRAVARNRKIPGEVLLALAQDHDAGVRRAVARNRKTPGEVLLALAQDHDAGVRRAVAEHMRVPVETLRSLSQDAEASVRIGVSMNEHTPVEVLQSLARDQDATVRWMANLVQRLMNETEEARDKQGWYQNLLGLFHSEQARGWIGDASIEKQLEGVAAMDVSEHLRQIILAAFAADWDTTKIHHAFAVYQYDESDYHFYEKFRARREHYRQLVAPFMPSLALKKLAASPSWEVRYLVALHEQTPSETRQALSQDGNRYVRAMARARRDSDIREPSIPEDALS